MFNAHFSATFTHSTHVVTYYTEINDSTHEKEELNKTTYQM